jgi:capsular polysaccharide biosynthesis protein
VELTHYYAILRRRWMPLVLVPLLVAIIVAGQVLLSQPSYVASAQFTVTRAPQQADLDEFRYNEYYLFLASEFMVDDLVEIVRGNVFATDVHHRVMEDFGLDVPVDEVQMAMSSERVHRILTIDIAHEDEDVTVAIAQSAANQLNENAAGYFGFEGDERRAVVQAIEFPDAAAPDLSRAQIFWVLQLAMALFGGLMIAIFLEYIDDRLHGAESVEYSLGLDVIGEVPRGKVSP